MENPASVRVHELADYLVKQAQAHRTDLINQYRQSLRNNLFTNRTEMRPSEIGNVAVETADAWIRGLSQPEWGMEYGAKLSGLGLSEQTILSLSQVTRQFVLTVVEKDDIRQALDIVDAYQDALTLGFMKNLEKLILAEQERIRGALQIAIGRYTVEIKDIQDMAKRATEASEFKTRFIARISHELRTPLGAILGISEMLQQSVYGPLTPAQMDITQRIINNTHNLERIFTEFLDQSQLELGQLHLREGEFSPQDLVQTVYSNTLPLALKKQLTMNVETDSALPSSLIGDRARIEQILSNLVVNAIKYTQTGGIVLHVAADGSERWIMQVKDTGIGISKEDQAHIFEAFHQVDENSGRELGGVGLGLAIVQQLVAIMKGTVSVKSEVGQGSTFTVNLPLRVPTR